MKIESATLQNSSSMHYSRQEEVHQSIRIQTTSAMRPAASRETKAAEDIDTETLDPKLRAIVDILERLLGKKITIRSFHAEGNASLRPQESVNNGQRRVGWGIEMSSSYSLNEEQSLAFHSSGRVATEDGREIDFSLNLQFHREFSLTQSTSFRAGDKLSDPLVISLDGSAPIGEGKFAFDLIRGGEMESISNLSANTGFLTIDKNNDGKVTDGSELFGPQSGDGFTELSRYDGDRNGWIDENDSVFKSLKLWIKTAESDQTITLAEAGIGALSLHAVDTSFDFKDSSNTTLAQLQKTSVALSESGEAKPLFGLNLAV